MDKFLEKYKNNIVYINELIDFIDNYRKDINNHIKMHNTLNEFEKRLRKDFNFLLYVIFSKGNFQKEG